MSDEERESISRIANQIRAYLSAHPQAADTLAGITGWWLGHDGTGMHPAAVQEALNYLVAERELTRIPSADGSVLYARRRREQ